MSFITKQLLAQSQMDLDSLKATIAAGGGSAELENKLRGLTKHVTHLSKQFAAEEAKLQMDKDATAAAENAKKAKHDGRDKKAEVEMKPKKPRFEDKTLQCCDCEGDFVFTGADQAFFARNDFAVPVRCAECRAAKKAAAPKPVLINCKDCKKDFSFSVGAQKYYKAQGWDAPVRCVDCRKAKKSKSSGSVKGGSVKSGAA